MLKSNLFRIASDDRMVIDPVNYKKNRHLHLNHNISNYRCGVLKCLIYIATILRCKASKNDGKRFKLNIFKTDLY